jgi:antibiotic biosynthesis monooxygenase (ABM) superfamily enzyme
MSILPEQEDEWNQWYSNIYTVNYEKVPGCIRARRWKALRGDPKYAVVYEFENENVSETPEWLRQRDIDPSNERMRQLMTHATGSPGIWKKTFQL